MRTWNVTITETLAGRWRSRRKMPPARKTLLAADGEAAQYEAGRKIENNLDGKEQAKLSVHNTVNMSAAALRRIMGQSFDHGKFEQGRQEARKFLSEHPEQRAEKLAEIKRRIENCDFERTPGASYWIGCLSEADFS